ncbi:MAG: Ig-like domain-containing protein, partial [Candidatus Roizmanbacteria bacterium]|nr:Ig-like domain-containing protein [Candidatus Roizmanbacteria bacterium]MCR4313151.1 Ig-like domain-containing protein [Candidatus Roizmanbacteria bacterium]
ILFVVLYFIFTFGIKLLLNTSSFISGLFPQPSTKPLSKTEDSFSAIDISSIPQATNSAKIIVSGSVLNFDSLVFYLNKVKVKEVDSPSDIFNEEIGDLEKGENSVYILAKSKDGKVEKTTITYKVFYKSEKPKLEITEPSDNSTTSNQEIKIKGSTDKETYIHINDIPVVVDAKGNFETTVRLKDGDNQITAKAQDIAGNEETKMIKVTYQKD